MERLGYDFFHRDCPEVARALVGKILVHRVDGEERRLRITETECYCSEADTACHAHKGRTKRTEVLYAPAGTIYVYLCYGMHWMLNLVTGEPEHPEAVLIRCCETAPGPGRLTKKLGITGALNRQSVLDSDLWVEDDGFTCNVRTDKRVGIGYATQEDQDRPWRFIMDQH
jgi:DNA-3-methyladenine glycosylase